LQLDQMRYNYIFWLSSPGDQHFFWSILCIQMKWQCLNDSNILLLRHSRSWPSSMPTILFSGRKFCNMEATLKDPNKLTLYEYYSQKAKVK
jgi:hypothetical protein